ncbi:MAG: hypothetical protein QOH65_2332 [Methylobacteriaceae bacterium]|jgi:hypothetical protein|nr:hypothetical protein [Methylobacteriaceae bacterium]
MPVRFSLLPQIAATDRAKMLGANGFCRLSPDEEAATIHRIGMTAPWQRKLQVSLD